MLKGKKKIYFSVKEEKRIRKISGKLLPSNWVNSKKKVYKGSGKKGNRKDR